MSQDEVNRIVFGMAEGLGAELVRLYPEADLEKVKNATQAAAADIFRFQPLMKALGEKDENRKVWSVTVNEPPSILSIDGKPKPIMAFVSAHDFTLLDPKKDQTAFVNWLVVSGLLREPLTRAQLYYLGYPLSFGLGARMPQRDVQT